MARPSKARRVCHDPGNFNLTSDRPSNVSLSDLSKLDINDSPAQTVTMTVDEYEAIRLIDYEGISQEECAVRMNIARTTAQAIYNSARHKLADCLINGIGIHVEGGNINVCDGSAGCPQCVGHE